jgi:hypothetical protein
MERAAKSSQGIADAFGGQFTMFETKLLQILAGERSSIVVACARRKLMRAVDYTGTAPPILWFATIQCVEGKQDLADLAPKDGFISTKSVEREVGQIGEAQEATREVGGGVDRLRLEAGRGFRSRCGAGRHSIGIDRVGLNEHRVDYLSLVRVNLASLHEFKKLLGLHVEQAGFHGGGAAKPP